MKTKTYVVTERAGPKVAGLRVDKGDELELTETEAASELLEGAIVEKGKQLHKAFTETTPKLKHAQQASAPDSQAPAPPADPASVSEGGPKPA